MDPNDPRLGRKFDTNKPMMRLLPPYALESIAQVLTFGAKKYAPDNWRYVEGRKERYLDALLRHLNAHCKGNIYDDETNFSHLAHAGCNLLFLLEEIAAADKSEKTSVAEPNTGSAII